MPKVKSILPAPHHEPRPEVRPIEQTWVLYRKNAT